MRSRCAPVAAVLATALLGCGGRGDRDTAPSPPSRLRAEPRSAAHRPSLEMRSSATASHASGAACIGATSGTSGASRGYSANGAADANDPSETGDVAADSSGGSPGPTSLH